MSITHLALDAVNRSVDIIVDLGHSLRLKSFAPQKIKSRGGLQNHGLAWVCRRAVSAVWTCR
jgi:hypothetical protein